jgi:Arc/MetJ family transcription regulator
MTEAPAVRTNIDIDDELLSRAMAATGLPTKKAAVEEGLQMLVRLREQERGTRKLKGVGWEGDLDAMRQGRPIRRLNRRR